MSNGSIGGHCVSVDMHSEVNHLVAINEHIKLSQVDKDTCEWSKPNLHKATVAKKYRDIN